MLDTQLLLWMAIDPERLPNVLRQQLDDRHKPLMDSVVSLWEVAVKTSLAKPGFAVDAGQLREGLRRQGLNELAINGEHCLAMQTLPWIHRDPFDRLLIAPSRATDLKSTGPATERIAP